MIPDRISQELHLLSGFLPKKTHAILSQFIEGYFQAVSKTQEAESILARFLEALKIQLNTPYPFEPYHQKVRKPFDYTQLGLDFVRLLIEFSNSSIGPLETLQTIEAQIKHGDNVILLANHQAEIDPQILSLMLEKKGFPILASSVLAVAGERVVTDPLAIPFSLGCDLLCIYSKRYIDNPPELKGEKLIHNKKTMEKMRRLLEEGGKFIYVAPSGGRDRKGSDGRVQVATFDPDSIELFFLMSEKAKVVTHFYPLTLITYDLLPPPETIQKELGEKRYVAKGAVHLFFSPEFDWKHYPLDPNLGKKEARKEKAEAIWAMVDREHSRLKKMMPQKIDTP